MPERCSGALSTTEVDQIIQADIGERLLAARDYERSGHADRARRLRSEAGILTSVASGEAPHSYGTGSITPGADYA